MDVNINDNVQCQLTEKGVKILKRKDLDLYENKFQKETNIFIEQLWKIMQIFGDEMYLGQAAFFVNNIINIDGSDS